MSKSFLLGLPSILETVGYLVSYLELCAEDMSTLDDLQTVQLRIFDIAQFDLRQVDLVCLSACNTGRVTSRGGNLLGMQWGFLHAGAYAILASHMPVYDYFTSQLMPEFYRLYTPELGKAKALCLAQISLREQGSQAMYEEDPNFMARFAHPYFWAPYAIYGYSGPIE